MPESNSEKTPVTAPAAPAKRSKTVAIIAIVAGLVAAVVGLVGVLTGGKGMDAIDLLLLAGGMLVSVLGFRGLRRARAN